MTLSFLQVQLGCAGSQQQGQENQQQEDEDDEEGSGKNDDLLDDIVLDQPSDLPHPKFPTSWNTKVLIMTNPLPEDDKIDSCKAQLRVVSEAAENQDTLLASEKQIFYDIKANHTIYHWCFYKVMTELDEKLVNDNMGISFEVKNQLFYNTMKSLWLLARSLDRVDQDGLYFDYLRKRYVELSMEYFARDVDILGIPLGDLNKAYAKPQNKKTKKPAGTADVDL